MTKTDTADNAKKQKQKQKTSKGDSTRIIAGWSWSGKHREILNFLYRHLPMS